MVLAEGDDLHVVLEVLAQSQLSDGLHGQAQQVGAQWGVLVHWERLPLSDQLLHQLGNTRRSQRGCFEKCSTLLNPSMHHQHKPGAREESCSPVCC